MKNAILFQTLFTHFCKGKSSQWYDFDLVLNISNILIICKRLYWHCIWSISFISLFLTFFKLLIQKNVVNVCFSLIPTDFFSKTNVLLHVKEIIRKMVSWTCSLECDYQMVRSNKFLGLGDPRKHDFCGRYGINCHDTEASTSGVL